MLLEHPLRLLMKSQCKPLALLPYEAPKSPKPPLHRHNAAEI